MNDVKVPEELTPHPQSKKNPGEYISNFVVFIRQTTTWWSSSLVDPFEPSKVVNTQLAKKNRVFSAALGAISFQAALSLYPYSYSLDATLLSTSFSSFFVSISIALFWVAISCCIFGGYDRNADFAHIFRASFIFNVFIYTVGKTGYLLNFGFVRHAAPLLQSPA